MKFLWFLYFLSVAFNYITNILYIIEHTRGKEKCIDWPKLVCSMIQIMILGLIPILNFIIALGLQYNMNKKE